MKQEHRNEELQSQSAEVQIGQREFAAAEDVIRFDRDKIAVPPAVARRVQTTLAQQPSLPWWKRLFGAK